MKAFLCLAAFTLLGLSQAMSVIKAESQEKDKSHNKNVLYFQPFETEEQNVGDPNCKKNPKFFCSGNQTCCEVGTTNGTTPSCCPYPQGTCCQDGKHCCPRGSFCDMIHKRCYRTESNGVQLHQMISISSSGLHKHPSFQVSRSKSVVCDDGSECPSGNTCCKDATGGYACCPLPKATCCSDHTHCCPNGYTCNVAAGKCNKGTVSLELFTKKPSTKPRVNEGTPCPGGEVSCPSDYTCCPMNSGKYGCCPLPEAVCCADGIHCCPADYKCDLSAGTCNKGDEKLPMFPKQPGTPAPAPLAVATSNRICPDQSSCPDGQTCCQNTQENYGCCPFADAVCCSDKVHCCPGGYTCDVAAGKCNKANDVLALFTRQTAKVAPNSVKCADGSSCPDGNTCCEDQAGSYACCPLPQATCCSDKLHCCPNGYTCDVAAGKCNKGNEALAWFTKKAAKSAPNSDVVCPDKSICREGNTCCQEQTGGYGCCPLPNAVCCSDKVHCCPGGYTCDVAAGKCNKGFHALTWFTKVPPKQAAPVNDVVCPDQSSCPTGNTCCLSEDGGYACCPLADAVCCSDKEHCCPGGYTCDVAAGTCLKGNDVLAWFTKQAAKQAAPVNDVVCPDQSSCPTGNTCCEAAGGGYACCPLAKAVCCSDKEHCCPGGYTCDVAAGTCLKGNDVLAWFTKQAAKQAAPVNDVVCPDQSSCPTGNTCCEAAGGGYACCPLEKAVCCSDKEHCCPSGYNCDVAAGTCNRGQDVLMWFTKQAAKQAAPVNDVVCPDQSSCPTGNTCCEAAGGGYACCPLEKAVCCSDKEHCCPGGYTCDVAAGTCLKGNDVLAWFTKQAAKQATPVNDVVCPDQSSCPTGNTCCEAAGGGYACCPLEKAVCCSDKEHCCPGGYTCDVAAGTCLKGNDVLAWFTKQAAKQAAPVNDVVCPDQSSCPTGNTCCEAAGGGYACCPLEKAVCCSDKEHCCPGGYTCDVAAGTCLKGNDVLSWFTKQAAKQAAPVNDVVCPDQSSCPTGNTCCESVDGGYACCPLAKAVCCSDKEHCCPSGYTCDVAEGKCNKGNDVLTWYPKQAATPAPLIKEIVCPDQSICPEGKTCCAVGQRQYGCCPVPNAVCCSDGVHCCPEGYQCEVSAGACYKGDMVVDWLLKQPAKK